MKLNLKFVPDIVTCILWFSINNRFLRGRTWNDLSFYMNTINIGVDICRTSICLYLFINNDLLGSYKAVWILVLYNILNRPFKHNQALPLRMIISNIHSSLNTICTALNSKHIIGAMYVDIPNSYNFVFLNYN